MSYASVQSIRESAGLLSKAENETPAGSANGTNKVFTTKRRPIVDSNNDDEVTIEDVSLFVNGASVPVASIDKDTGTVNAVTAPVNGAKVTIDYHFSPISDEYVEGKQEEADDWVDTKIRTAGILPAPNLPLEPIPGVISTIAELYAAGIILTRDQGSRYDGEQTSRDGFSKIKQARELMEDFLDGLRAENQTDNNAAYNTVSIITDANVFARDFGDEYCDPEDRFMRPGAYN